MIILKIFHQNMTVYTSHSIKFGDISPKICVALFLIVYLDIS